MSMAGKKFGWRGMIAAAAVAMAVAGAGGHLVAGSGLIHANGIQGSGHQSHGIEGSGLQSDGIQGTG